ncbi:unnamed protein product, partial [Rotaria sp. Silwood1]
MEILNDYAFVHFDKRDDALNAMRALNGKMLGRNSIEVSLAKPLSDKRKQAQSKREQRKPFDGPRNNFGDNTPSGFTGGPASSGFGGFNNDLPRGGGGGGGRSDDRFNVNTFGAFSGNNLMNSGPSQPPPPPSSSSRGGPSQRGNNRGGRSGGSSGNRGGGFNSSNRSGNNNFNPNNRGGFNSNNYRGNYGGPPQNNNSGGYNNNNSGYNQMGGGYNNQ